ncbi:MAG: BlaI/MecI/CopY family transcriptional regulator [Eubacteriales bacterium]|nr:BlaI/MecI/CopY family transcriptional regulator [Eubacteriales bacterium]
MERKLLDAEWTILHALWGKKPQTMREIIASVQAQQLDVGWQYKTYHSYLRIMLCKGLIGCEDKNKRDKLYFALVSHDEALRQESETLLSRISAGSMGAMVAMMARDGQLSDKDREDLLELAARLEAGDGGEQP